MKISFADYPKNIISDGFSENIFSKEEINKYCLENPYGYFIKIKVTEKYENALYYKETRDYNNILESMGCEGY